ncbi:MAG: serine hydrolase [Eubacteriales bacterium]|nr:serine hydrolase [Eubacteriales bacterium]
MKTKKLISITLSLIMLLSATIFTTPASATTFDSPVVELDVKSKDFVATTATLPAYQNYLDRLAELKEFTGVAYLTKDGYVLSQIACGMQNTKENKEMTIDTLFPLGSVSKQFCATAVLLLQEQGKLSVNDKLSKYFPEYTIGKDITIHDLLSMRSGIRDHVNNDDDYIGHEDPFLEYKVSATATNAENIQAITQWLFTQKLKFTPGSAHSYSNANFLLLSIIVEQVSNMSYMDFIKQNIFIPLNMTNSGFYEEIYGSPDLAEPKLEEGEEPIEPYLKGLSQGAGDLVSNAKDMDKWLTALSDCTILSEESYKAMSTNHGSNYGYGFYTDTKKGSVFHAGNIATYESFVLTFPQENLNVFVITNDVYKMRDNNLPMSTFGQGLANRVRTSSFGDIDDDGSISVHDATAVQMHVAQLNILTDKELKRADTNADSLVSVLDATQIQRLLAKL